jgi:hypothetical protein
MKYRFEDFRDWRELLLWYADNKPIKCGSNEVLEPLRGNFPHLKLNSELVYYKKIIEIKEQECSFYVNFYRDENGTIHTKSSADSASPYWTKLKTEKFTTTLEV